MIRNLIFDYGGVLMDLDFRQTLIALKQLLKVDFKDETYRNWFFELFKSYEKNGISDEAFLDKLRSNSDENPTSQELIMAWNALMISIKKERFDMLTELKKNYGVYLLSNTNGVHYENMLLMAKDLLGPIEIDSFFHKSYYSHLVNMRKPDKEIFDLICSENKLDRKETLFIDDLPFNVEGAIKAGLHSIQHDPKTEITENIHVYISRINEQLS